eukprot:TRINITY_DN6061_c0_g1_i1.p1 TRINITY_DN6061_c0_g1~~TRINITY_DN6061_c0_g1_i1.p1  ORF type:complete len:446 (-),score=156.17 TRINITY_DN6061_c0_g1_i1:213-1550(-)
MQKVAPGDSKPVEKKQQTIIFDSHVKELVTLSSGFKKLQRKLRSSFKIVQNKEEITPEVLAEASLVVFGGPQEKLKESEFKALKQFIDNKGSVLFFSGEGGDQTTGTNFNYFLEEYGIEVQHDSVVRTAYLKYLHPKEVLIADGVINREINRAAGKATTSNSAISQLASGGRSKKNTGPQVNFVYPYGSTLQVVPPAIPVLSSGYISYPINRPISAFYTRRGAGRLAVFGSARIFNDEWLEVEENAKLQEVVFKWLLDDTFNLDAIDAKNPDLTDYHYLPNCEKLSERLRSCLQDTEEIPKDYKQMFDETTFKFDTHHIPDVMTVYQELGVKHDALTLIPPQFDVPLPPLVPATFPPILNEPPPPMLDLFDLDEQFASEKVRLAYLTNLCNDEDLEYYVKECGDVLGVTQHLKADNRSAKHVLEYIMKAVVNWKKLNQDAPMDLM